MGQETTKTWDCLIIGGGPAALSAAVYTSREDIQTLIVEKGVVGGLAAITEKVDNYPGFAQGVAGLELAQQLQQQAERFGTVLEMDEVLALKTAGSGFVATLASQQQILTKTVLIATGSEWKKLNIEGEDQFYGRGIHNCATCDGAFYRDKELIVIGGGNSAAQESLFLTKFAKKIQILIRKDHFKASDILVKDVEKHPKIEVCFQTSPRAFRARSGGGLEVVVERGGQEELMSADGVFVFIGLRPNTGFLDAKWLKLDEFGFVLTDISFATNVPGIFAAGDVRSGATMQIASAVGEGASAALSIRHFLEQT